MNSNQLRKQFLDFFEKRGHKIVPSSSLLPADPSVLFTTAGMQQFSLYLSGRKDPLKDFGSRHLASAQKCFRTGDIEEIGDDTHHTFFEMLGNWSIGEDENGYFKEGSIKYALQFLQEIGLDKEKFYITIFKGDEDIEKDGEAKKIWMENGIKEERIREFDREDNFWGPVSDVGPCGPCSEIHYDRGEEYGCGKECGPNCPNCKRFVEIWNLVFMQYFKNQEGKYELLNQRNIDTGIGFERLLSIINEKDSAFDTDLFEPLISRLEEISKKQYKENIKAFRIISDHIRGSVFLISEGVEPSNMGQGYVLRRLLRRIVRYSKALDIESLHMLSLAKIVIGKYGDIYPQLKDEERIYSVIEKEINKFEKTLKSGLSRLEKLIESKEEKTVSGEEAFDLYQSFGFPIELTCELAREKGFSVEKDGFEESLKKHQELSRAGAEKKFGGVGKDASYEATKLHSATHLLHSALRKVLGDHVEQKGSDITPQRLRFDFSHPRKLREEEISQIEDIVNEKIKEGLLVKKEQMPLQKALKSDALAFFREKYPETVNVFTFYNKDTKEVFSREICAGPHVESTSELGRFKILKEKSSQSGVRRIKANLE